MHWVLQLKFEAISFKFEHDVMGCETDGLHVFRQMMKSNYKRLYPDQKNLLSDPMEKQRQGIRADLFLREVETLIRENQQLQCTS